MTMISYKGDALLSIDSDGDMDINISNGQPEMTEFIDNLVTLYIFGEKSWYNSIVETEAEKMKSRFPEFIKTANVSNEVLAEGIAIITEALQPIVDQRISNPISVDGEIISVHGIRWTANIEQSDGITSRYSVLWEKGFTKLEKS